MARSLLLFALASVAGSTGGMVASASANNLGGGGDPKGRWEWCAAWQNTPCGYLECSVESQEYSCDCGCFADYIYEGEYIVGEVYACGCACGYVHPQEGYVFESYSYTYCYYYY